MGVISCPVILNSNILYKFSGNERLSQAWYSYVCAVKSFLSAAWFKSSPTQCGIHSQKPNNPVIRNLTNLIKITALPTVEFKHVLQHFQSLFILTRGQKELRTFAAVHCTDARESTGEAEDQVEETPGVEVDVQVWDVVREGEMQHGYW